MPPVSPALAAWELGMRLREAREQLGLTGTEAGEAPGVVQNYISNVELGRRVIAKDKLVKLMAFYGFEQSECEELLALRTAAEERGWWWRYSGTFSPELLRFIGYEHGAEEICCYESTLISGLLQTESYARAVHRGDGANLRKSEVERRVEVRLQRRSRIVGPEPTRTTVIMCEATLWQQIGGSGVLAEQLQYLLDVIDEHPDTLDLRILPFTAGSCGAMGSSTFHVLTFPYTRLPRIAWQETAISMHMITKPVEIEKYRATFDEALLQTADREGSTRLIKEALVAIT